MTREELQALIDRVIGKKDILRAPSYWMRRVFGNLMDYTDGKAEEGKTYTQEYVDSRLVFAKDVTYSELRSFRNNRQLVAGQQYRITDYETIVGADGCRSAGYLFDLVVTAIGDNLLAPQANAVKTERDGAYQYSDIDTWEIMYSLDNSSKYPSASNRGKGVIYWMKDGDGFEAPYDFKNIQFLRKHTKGQLDNDNGADGYFFTFSGYYENSGNIVDLTRITAYDSDNNPHKLLKLGTVKEGSWDNVVIKVLKNESLSNGGQGYADAVYSIGPACVSNTFSVEFRSNGEISIGATCKNNVVRHGAGPISIAERCENNIIDFPYQVELGADCYDNSIICKEAPYGRGARVGLGLRCYGITRSNAYEDLILGDDCYNCTLNGYCRIGNNAFNINLDGASLIAGDNCMEIEAIGAAGSPASVSLGDSCHSITVRYGELKCGNACTYIEISSCDVTCGDECFGIHSNTGIVIGDYCSDFNIAPNGRVTSRHEIAAYFGNSCHDIQLPDCPGCIFGNDCGNITATPLSGSIGKVIVSDKAKYLNLSNSPGSDAAVHITIDSSVKGTSSSPFDVSLAVSKPTTYFVDTSGNLRSYSTEDLLGGESAEVVDNLESESTTAALSANQGRVLNKRFCQLPSGLFNSDRDNWYKLTAEEIDEIEKTIDGAALYFINHKEGETYTSIPLTFRLDDDGFGVFTGTQTRVTTLDSGAIRITMTVWEFIFPLIYFQGYMKKTEQVIYESTV